MLNFPGAQSCGHKCTPLLAWILGTTRHSSSETPDLDWDAQQHTCQLCSATAAAVRAVERVGRRVAQVATDGFGGGFQEHMKDLQWEFVVIR